MKREWNGLIVCGDCYEERHPQDFVRAKEDRIAPYGPTRPASNEVFVSRTYFEDTYTGFNEDNAVAGLAIAGKAVAGKAKVVEDNVSFDNQIPGSTNNAGSL